MLPRILKAQRGFTLIELMAVMSIMLVLAGIVAGAVTGIGASGQNARLQADADTLGKAADRFFNDAFPQSYPVLSCCGATTITPVDITTDGGDLGVRLIDFDAVLPGTPTKKFAPDFLKEIPDTAALVSWRIVTASGQVFFAQDGAKLVRPSNARLDVSALGTVGGTTLVTGTGTSTAIQADYKFKLRMNKNEAAPEILGISIPAGYAIGGQGLASGVTVGTLSGTFSTDNPWTPGTAITFSGALKATGSPNEWTLEVLYPDSVNGAGAFIANAGFARADRTAFGSGSSAVDDRHKVSIATPSAEAAGALKIALKTCGGAPVVCDKAHNQATETWELTIYGQAGGANLITNPAVKGVYRWLATQHTTIDVADLFSSMAGNQAVVIK